MTHPFLSGFHIATAFSALIFGLCVFMIRKGTRLHKQFGYAYFFNMLGLNLSALFIYRLTGQLGLFHAAALASLATVLAGFVVAYLRLPNGRWLEMHYDFMNWSYAGLVAAAVAEATTRIPAAPFWPAVFGGSLLVFWIAGILITRGRSRYQFEAMARQTHGPRSFAEAFRRRRVHCS